MRILIAEDDPVSRRILQAQLEKWTYEVAAVSNGEEAWRTLQNEQSPRLAILDWMMPQMDGVQVCQMVRRLRAEPYTYIILLTSRDLKEDVIQGIEAGADDYLSKPYHVDELRARLRAGTRILDLQESLMKARDALHFQATHDSLSELWNRGAVLEALQRELSRARREHTPVSLMVIDLDFFKRVNDTHGHLVGDEVLREGARRLRSSVRAYDTVGRYGGEEFLIVLPGCHLFDAVSEAQKLRAVFAGTPFVSSAGPIAVTMSVGVAGNEIANCQDATSIVRAADEALYRAKQAGRNRVELAADSVTHHISAA